VNAAIQVLIPERPDVAWIKKYVPIVDVAREVRLQVFGRTKAGCWRIENHRNGDAHPSVRFLLRKNIARCFVCDQIGGFSNIDLVMGVLNCDFSSAVSWICERFLVPSARRGRPIGQRSSWSQYYRVGVSGSELELLVRSGLWGQLSPSQRAILPVLLAFRNPDTAVTTISYRGLMRFAGIGSPKSIAGAVWRLQALHVLKIERSSGAGVVRDCSSYRLTLDDPELIRLLNATYHRQRHEIECERAFRSEARNSREKAIREAVELDLRTNTKNNPEEQPQSCTGELLCSLSEVRANKSLHLVKRGEEESQKAGIL